MWHAFWSDEDGATAIEYALIAMLISVSIIAAGLQLSASMEAMYNNTAAEVSTAISGAVGS